MSTVDVGNSNLGAWNFKNGTATESDEPGGATADWEIKIAKNLPFKPGPGILFRVIQFERIHLTGSGTLRPVNVVGCRTGKLTSDYSNKNAEIIEVTNDRIRLQTYGEYLGGAKGFEAGPIVELKYDRHRKTIVVTRESGGR